MKKITIAEVMVSRIVLALALTYYYWMWARTDWKESYPMIQYVIGTFLIWFCLFFAIRSSKYQREIMDEMARENLQKCDSICLKTFVVVMVITAYAAAILGHTGTISTAVFGWVIMISIVVLAILRAILFVVMDRKGM